MQLRCAACGYINQLVDDSTAFCPNCGSAYLPPIDPGIPHYDVTLRQPTPEPPPLPPTPAHWSPDPDYAEPLAAFLPLATTPPPNNTSQRPGRRSGLVLGLVIVAAVIAIGAIGFAAYAVAAGKPAVAVTSATPTPTPTQKPLIFRHYVDPQGFFALNYPTSWQVKTSPAQTAASAVSVTTFAGENRAATLDVYVGGTQLTLSSAITQIDQHYANSFAVLHAPQTVTINGLIWQEERGVFLRNGRNIDVVLLVTQQNGHTYLLSAASAELTFARIDATIFLPMLESLSVSAG